MASTAYSGGGVVEHEVSVLLNICRLSTDTWYSYS